MDTWGWFAVIRNLMPWVKKDEAGILQMDVHSVFVELRMMKQERQVIKERMDIEEKKAKAKAAAERAKKK